MKVLEELRIPVDCITGTSMGAIVGSLYAVGYSGKEIEEFFFHVDWDAGFRDDPPRNDFSFRRKQDDVDFLMPARLGFNHGQVQLPLGAVGGQNLLLTLRNRLWWAYPVATFQQLAIPFRAYVVDLASGRPVFLDHGDLSVAVRASMSLAGIFTPTVIDGNTWTGTVLR